MDEIIEGQTVIIDVETRLKGVLKDPENVSCMVKAPNGTVTTYVYPSAEVRRLDMGQYEVAVVVGAPGSWGFRAVSSGIVDAVKEVPVNVRASHVI